MLGWTPLHFIAMQGQPQAAELAKVLISHGLDLAAVDNQGRGWKHYWQHGKEIYAVWPAPGLVDTNLTAMSVPDSAPFVRRV